MLEFPKFGQLVHECFESLIQGTTFEAGSGDVLWEQYLAAFPEGTNPIFKKKTEHDCSCCRHFIRRAGIITDGSRTVWDKAAEHAPYPYNVVAKKMREAVLGMKIHDLYLVNKKEGAFGARETRTQEKSGAPVVTFNHFYTGDIPLRLRLDNADSKRGEYRTTVEVFERGLKELKPDAVKTVLSLIDANNLYRGEEHKAHVIGFMNTQKAYMKETEKSIFVWKNAQSPVARFRNTVIGTLVQDLSDGMDVERAVAAFETKVAPQNYKRTTAVITPMMVKKAMETITALGLESALERRFARIADINVNDVLWVGNEVRSLMKGGLEAVLMKEAKVSVPSENAEEISIDRFTSMFREITGLEVFLSGSHLGNFVSLTAPVHPEPKQLFRWGNDFAWSYTGNVADSIKERVKKAGGKVTGALRVSLSWFNFDDLDLHIKEPVGEIYYGNKRGMSGGCLDVDMNAGGGSTREPVENVAWDRMPRDGKYEVIVNQYSQREHKDVGFSVEIEFAGKIHHFSYNKAVPTRRNIDVCTLVIRDGAVSIEGGDAGITTTALSQDKWGVKSETFVKVNAVTLSPNYWGENRVGNRHLFMFLEGCQSDEPMRGVYNEFLHPRLEEHRKVFEVIGEKTKCQPTDGQLSGLGFSSTKKETVLVRVNGKRLYKVNTGGK